MAGIAEGFVDMDAVEGCKGVVGLFLVRRRRRNHNANNNMLRSPKTLNAEAKAMVCP
jgi:hypothetical protein